MYHIVYLTRNLKTNKIYIGVHSTYNLNDGYLGSGKALQNSIQKYGKKAFETQIIYFCLTAEDAYQTEATIVDKQFISRKDNYNINIGGGMYNGNKRKGTNRSEEIKAKISTKLLGRKLSDATKERQSQAARRRDPAKQRTMVDNMNAKGKTAGQIAKQKAAMTGRITIFNVETKEVKLIFKEQLEEYSLHGWIPGRGKGLK